MTRRRFMAAVALILPLAGTTLAGAWGMYYSLQHDAQPGSGTVLMLGLFLGPFVSAAGGMVFGLLRGQRGGRLVATLLAAAALGVVGNLVAMRVTYRRTDCINVYDVSADECGFGTGFIFAFAELELVALVVVSLLVLAAVWSDGRQERASSQASER